ncbi:cytochrome P450 [Streptomyces sp. NBC_00378]|uniref:cytochrome P450 n=1 Tax=unclassified Streptomyces TaxID=2593676 RepID=UPI00225208A7|nr:MULTISPECIES: cytochrome P450 [unclassified Streptomyces]MCX5108595.1 cytochrome P450 [Streptomyces sp. NBC_00378]
MKADVPEGISAPGLGRRGRRPVRGPRPDAGPSLLAPGAARDPYRLYRVLREEYPLSYDAPLRAWLVSRYADVATALTDPRFTGLPHDAAPRGAPAPLGLCHGSPRCVPRDQRPSTPGTVPCHMSEFEAVPRHMPELEAVPRHMPELAAVPRHMAARIERTAYVLARRIAGRQQADLVEEFCRWLPFGAAPGASARRYADRLSGTTRGTMPGIAHGTTPGIAYGPPPVTATAATPCTRHTGLRERALASLLANVLDAPGLLAALRVEPALADRAWTESLRRDPPVQVVLRRTVTEVTLSGGTLPAGADVACLIGAAGRDPERFAAPDLFDPFRRDQGRSLTGPVSCPAVLLGRLEARQGLLALLDAMPRLRWADGFRPAGTGLLTRGPRALLVRPG